MEQIPIEQQPSRLKRFFNRRNKVMWILLVLLILLIGAIVWRYVIKAGQESDSSRKSSPFSLSKIKEAVKTQSKINGEMVTENSDRHTLAVSIENHPDARPQSGLNKASVIFEAVTEGGITRFLAIFGPYDAPEIGPVRSARSFFVDWLQGFDAYFAHAGGAPDALEKISADRVMDLPHTTGYFERKEYKSVASEHTLYTTTKDLYKLAEQKGYSKVASFTAWQFEKEADLAQRGNQETIDVNYGGSYQVQWKYDKTNNQYLRFLDGVEHKDRTTGEQLIAKDIVIITVDRQPYQPPGGKSTFKFTTIGSGKAVVIKNGAKTEGAWKKTASKDQIKFLDSANNEIPLVGGKIWIEVIPPEMSYTIKELPVTTTSSAAVIPPTTAVR